MHCRCQSLAKRLTRAQQVNRLYRWMDRAGAKARRGVYTPVPPWIQRLDRHLRGKQDEMERVKRL